LIHWIFFDIGNVLFVDEPIIVMHWLGLHDAIRDSGHQISFEPLMERRETLVRKNQDHVPYVTLGHESLGEEGWAEVQERNRRKFQQDHFAYNFMMEGAEAVLRNLSTSYKLGVAANKPKICRKALATAGLLDYFSVVEISAERNLSKPDPRFFKSLLAEADCMPAEAIMIGDRIDNDIAPAKGLGMHSIWFDLDPVAHGSVAISDREKVFIDSLSSVPSRGTGHPGEEIAPDATVTSLAQILDAIERIPHDRD